VKFFREATKIRIFRNGRSCTVWSSNPALVSVLKKTLEKVGYICYDGVRNTVIITNTERFLPAAFFITEVREALNKAGFTSANPEWASARCDTPELNGAFSNIIRSLEAGKTAVACA
jgi:hypothetical protein